MFKIKMAEYVKIFQQKPGFAAGFVKTFITLNKGSSCCILAFKGST